MNQNPRTSNSSTPHTVDLLSHLRAQAPVRHAQQGIPIERYYRSASLLLRQVEQYRTGQESGAYFVFLLRYVQLVLQTIPEHGGFASGKSAAYRRLREEAKRLMPELERMQKELDGVRVQVEDTRREPRGKRGESNTQRVQGGHVPGVTWENQDIATFPSAEIKTRQQEGGDERMRESPSDVMKAIVGSIDGVSASASLALTSHPLASHTKSTVNVSVGDGKARLYPDPRVGMRLGPQEMAVTSLVPASSNLERIQVRNHQEYYGDHAGQDGHATATTMCCTPAQLEAVPHAADKVTQTIRNVHISAALMNEFMRYASSNTRASIETCGILAGGLVDMDGSGQLSTFVISHLIVPKQEGTSDTVQALAEEEIYDAQDSRSLYPLGWIHTHPTQTCFLSSIDVHTQCGYQTMLDEAIAIVMAPTDAKSPVGIFRLSTPGGLKLIQRCEERGFHPHGPTETGQPLYELCNHVYLDPGIGFEVLDLRHQ